MVTPSSAAVGFDVECLGKLRDFTNRCGLLASALVYRAGFDTLGGEAQTVPWSR